MTCAPGAVLSMAPELHVVIVQSLAVHGQLGEKSWLVPSSLQKLKS